jgi:flagellar FliL protein
MSDSDDLDLEGGDAPDSGGAPKKRGGGVGNLLPNLLKFVAIGLGALIFIVTVSVITYNIMSGGGKSQTPVIGDPSSPYVGVRPELAYYDSIGSITVKTKDGRSNVIVDMIIGYDLNDQVASGEISSRKFELIDFTRRYFALQDAVDLSPDREDALKKDIREQLNTRFFDKARARNILFKRLDVNENY